MAEIDEKGRAAAIKAVGKARRMLTGATLNFQPSDALLADAAVHAYESAKQKEAEGWRDIASAPTPVMIGSSFGLGRDYDKLVWFHAGVPTHWRPLPEPPSALLSAGGEG